MISSDKLYALRARPARFAAKLSLADGLVYSSLILLTLLFGIQLWQSLQWHIAHDAVVVHYGAYLFERHGFVPYRDLFDTVLPGAYLFHLLIGKTLGFGDFAFRLVDVAMLLALVFVTWALLRPLGKAVTWAGPLLFGLVYLGYGPSMSLQRDYLGLLPIATALLIASRTGPKSPGKAWRYLLIGALFGMAFSIKPHLVLGLPIVLLLAVFDCRKDWRTNSSFVIEMLSAAVPAAIGLIMVAFVPVLWVWQRGGLHALLDILRDYLPLYLQLNGNFEALGRSDLIIGRFTSFQKLGGLGILLAPAALGGYLALFESRLPSSHRRLVVTLLTLTGVYGLYTVLAGQFWNYHWMPFLYFSSLSASLVLVTLANQNTVAARRTFVVAVFVGAVVLTVRPAPDFYRQIMGNPPRPAEDGRVDEIAAFLRKELRPGDRVQPLDFVSGGINNALLQADAVLATRYQFDSQLYHHVSSPNTQARQQDLLNQLQSAPPRFIIEYPDRPRPSGIDTIQSLPELQRFVAEQYELAQVGRGYLIYERAQ